MSPIRMLVSDVDGTLVTPDKRLTSATIAAVRNLRHHGILFTLTSSRPAFGLRALCKALDLDLPIGPFNGSSIIDPAMRPLEQSLIPAGAAARCVDLLQQRGIDIWVFTAMPG